MTDLRQEIDTLLDQINTHELRLEGKRMRLGALLREVEVSGKWKEWGFEKFSRYVVYVCEKIDKRKSQVYSILQAATDLLPYMSEEKLEEIGITKAHELRRFVIQSMRRPDVEIPDSEFTLLEYASWPETTAAKLRLQVNRLLHQEETPQGNWYDLKGCYFTLEEKKTWETAVELGEQAAEVEPTASDHERLKASLLVLAQEAISSLEPFVQEVAA